MATKPLCSILGCDKPAYSKGWCQRHYYRSIRHGSPLGGRPAPGEPKKWLMSLAFKVDDDHCIPWPYAIGSSGYGVFVEAGTQLNAHRYICEAAHGAPPQGDIHAAHSCGIRTCVNPNHLRWASRSENENDKVAHGLSNRGERCGSAILTEDEVRDIRILLARGETQKIVGDMFGVSEGAINSIHRRQTWAWLE